MMIADDSDLDFPANERQALWQERERRQRSVRFFMMFLLMLLLMDGEEQSQRRRSHDGSTHLRGKSSKSEQNQGLDSAIFYKRQEQDRILAHTIWKHPRYHHLIHKNDGKDFDSEIRAWAEQQLDLEKDEFASGFGESSVDREQEKKVFHFPWNATGFYRGEWAREDATDAAAADTDLKRKGKALETSLLISETEYSKPEDIVMDTEDLEAQMGKILMERQESLGVFLLPPGIRAKLPNSTVSTEQANSRQIKNQRSLFLRGTTPAQTNKEDQNEELKVTLTKNSGRAAFQLYSRSVPATKEISILNGFVKLYDSNTVGYSTRRDILLRVNGVIFHSLGKISLVSNAVPGRSALIVNNEDDFRERRKLLQEKLSSLDFSADVEKVRDETLLLFSHYPSEIDRNGQIQSLNMLADESIVDRIPRNPSRQDKYADRLQRRLAEDEEIYKESNLLSENQEHNQNESNIPKSHQSTHIFPYPYVVDDKDQTVERTRTPAARSMPPREQLLEANAKACEFEISMNVQEEEWTLGQWRALLSRQTKEAAKLEPFHLDEVSENVKGIDQGGKVSRGGKNVVSSQNSKPIQDQALVMTMNGTIRSPNCNFSSHVNATAIRTDWENTTGKAINYSFYMMLTCLTQIVLLLRQLLHTQTQSAATKVSLLCIGWQTVLDALLCLVHIYLSLAMQPLFTAFASVAFFKLLIFCVIEMKYMAIIIQARNANNGGNSIELLRRQIAMLHLRFYVALIGCFLLFFYAWESYRTVYILALYSFWVPQIIQNIVTEAKRPLHRYYIHGMSFTRLIAPLYMFAVQNNFLKEVYPDSPTNVFMCQILIIWVGIQSAVLEAQGRYGARFMIPSRFLPPKFDYSRPIPDSLLPSGGHDMTPSEELRNERGQSTDVRPVISSDNSPLRSSGGARNRIKGSRAHRSENSMTTETLSTPPSNPPSPSFDCVICYSEIDIRDRRGYMLAPCDHLFHRECLEQWMEVKMECPICRHDLPSL